MTISIISEKKLKTQKTNNIVKFNEYDFAIALTNEVIEKSKTGKVNISKFTNLIKRYGQKYAKKYVNENFKDCSFDCLYNHFVGDYFEAFAEFMLKNVWQDPGIPIRNYVPTYDTDYGVDGYGTNLEEKKIVVQVKFRSQWDAEITYSALARTFTDGVCNFDIDGSMKKCVYLFTNCFGQNYVADNAMKDKVFIINRNTIERRISDVEFWKQLLEFIK